MQAPWPKRPSEGNLWYKVPCPTLYLYALHLLRGVGEKIRLRPLEQNLPRESINYIINYKKSKVRPRPLEQNLLTAASPRAEDRGDCSAKEEGERV